MCIGVRTKNGKSPLDLALKMLFEKESFPDIANYLIKSGCHGDEIEEKLLCGACRWGKLEIVKELVKKLKVDPNGEYLRVFTILAIFLNRLRDKFNVCMHLYKLTYTGSSSINKTVKC